MSIIKKFKRAAHYEHIHQPSKIEFTLAILITTALVVSLVTQQFLHIPRYLTTILILLFISVKIRHVLKHGGALLEDYTAIGAVALFLVLYMILKEDINISLTIIFIFILLYSTGLMLWIKTSFESKKIAHFLISYITTVIMAILLFTGAYTSGNGSFLENQNEKQLSFLESLYFSTVTFTTVGYGDIIPLGINRLFASFEALLGIIINVGLIGYLLASGRYNSQGY